MKYGKHYSYIKDIYVELRDYSFFHSPSQGENTNRFVGRTKLKQRLSELLSKGETKSGAYLITGYRGVGKSTLVSQVLEELSLKKFMYLWWKISRPIFLTFLIAVFIDSEVFPHLFLPYWNIGAWGNVLVHYVIVLGTLVGVKMFSRRRKNGAAATAEDRKTRYTKALALTVIAETAILLYRGDQVSLYFSAIMIYCMIWTWLGETSYEKNDVKVKYSTNVGRFLMNMLMVFSIDVQKFPKQTHYHLIQIIFIVASPFVIFYPVFFLAEWSDLFTHIRSYTFLEVLLICEAGCCAFILLMLSIKWLVLRKMLNITSHFAWINEVSVSKFKEIINYSRRINIKINLSHEDLRETSILKLISKRIYSEYQAVNNVLWGFPFNVLNRILKFAIIFGVLYSILYSKEVEKSVSVFKESTGLTSFFPSQGDQLATSSSGDRGGLLRACTRFGDDVIKATYSRFRQEMSVDPDAGPAIFYGIMLPFDRISGNALPEKLDYLFIIFFAITWTASSYMFSHKIFGIVTHGHLLRRFRNLNDRLESEVEVNISKTLGFGEQFLSMFKGKRRTFPIAGAREIESELLSILDEMDRVPRLFVRPEFIITLDELDKVKRHENTTIDDKESQDPDMPSNSTESSRMHRESMMALLANLKHFFTTARAKFIFIAGRELYDASLADISDRNYFMGSIFHDVIYVNSLLTDDRGASEAGVDDDAKTNPDELYHTSLIEEYICRFLIPQYWSFDARTPSLKMYKDYLYYFFSVNEIPRAIDLVKKFGASPPSAGNDEYKDLLVINNYRLLGYLNHQVRMLSGKSKKPFLSATDVLRLTAQSGIFKVMVSQSRPGERKWFSRAFLKIFRWLTDRANQRAFRLLLDKLSTNNNQILEHLEKEKQISKNADYILFNIRNFINYISYRSGGAPKKVTFLLEQYLLPVNTQSTNLINIKKSDLSVVVGRSTSNLYLHFQYYDLYTFGAITYLTRPFLHSISRYLKKHDDKLAVSSTYLLDHFYKFHNSGFSWINLEVTPEIVDVNKAPSLRRLIFDIVQFLSNIHLDKVVSGLYDFRFNQRLAQEISILSKVNPRESAALNFTLDESQEIKRHYRRKLNELLKEYLQGSNKAADFVHSIGFLHGNLGDLHYYDQEYDDALVQYKDAVQALRNKPCDASQFLVAVRIMLRIGITYEKKKAFASAMLTYEDLSKAVVDYLESMEISKMTPDLGSYILEARASEKTSIRVLYQPFFAKLYLKEKEKIGGIKMKDLEMINRELMYLTESERTDDQLLTRAEYYNKIGDLLFFKNAFKDAGEKDCGHYYKLAIQSIGNYLDPSEFPDPEILKPNDLLFQGLQKIVGQIRDEQHKYLSSDSMRIMANNITDLADTELSAPRTREDENGTRLNILTLLHQDSERLLNPDIVTHLGYVDRCIALYLLAGKLYELTNDHKKSALQRIKILHIIKQVAVIEDLRGKMDLIKKIIVEKTLADIYTAFNASARPEMERIKSMLNSPHLNNPTALAYLPPYAEVQEVVALFLMIRHKADEGGEYFREDEFDSVCDFANNNCSNMYSRLVVVNMKARYNFKYLNQATDIERMLYLVADSIYCLTTAIRILNTMGLSYITNHALFAFAFEKRAFWCWQLQQQHEGKDRVKLERVVRELLGSESLDHLQPKYNYEKAIEHWKLSLESHSGKNEYQNMIEKMYYLDDDFDDEYYHFHAALERSRISLEDIRVRIAKLEEKIMTPLPAALSLYEADSYV